MYSQCPKCQAIFSVSEGDIAAHHGLVRCGHCGSIFHAVDNEVADVRVDAGQTSGAVGHAGTAGTPDNQTPAEEAPASSTLKTPSEMSPDTSAAAYPRHAEEGAPVTPAVSEERAEPEPPKHIAAPAPEESREDTAGTGAGAATDTDTGDSGTGSTAPQEPELPAPGADASRSDEDAGLPGEIIEEITIEAPPVLWDAFDDEVDDEAAGARQAGKGARAAPAHAGQAPPAAGPDTDPAEVNAGTRAPLRSPYRDRDVRMVELPRPRPFKTAILSLLTVLLALLAVWQAKTFYLDELAQVPALRPWLESVCRPLACTLPPRRDFAQIDLAGTSIDVNPEIPGALEIKASLINRAHFPQPYPPLRITLTDREGRVVGRRTYLPSEYLGGDRNELLPIKESRDVMIKLAQPSENASGYEVELMAPAADGGES